MTDRVGQQLGNYRLVSLLGEGGFAEVYLGEHIHLGTQAAIKVLHTQLVSDDMEQFRTEARTIAHLEHPHIVRILDFGIEGKTPFLVMGYAPHGTLRQRHPKGVPLPLAIIVSYIKHIADALQYAHDEKLIHRDIKPENMLLGRRNEVLLSDFGIAMVAQSSRYQSTQDVIGTVAYMAPEQIQGKPRPASDQYSLGVVVYEWISGGRPFHGSFTELCTQHMFASPPSLHQKIPAVTSEVEQVVQTALAKDPKERFLSIQAFANALEQASQLAQSHPSVSTFISDQPLPPTVIAPSPNQLPLPTQFATPPGYSILPTEMVLSSDQPNQPPVGAISSGQMQQPSLMTTSQERPQQFKRGVSRRAVTIGLAGATVVAVAGGGLAWLLASQKQPLTVSPDPAGSFPGSTPQWRIVSNPKAGTISNGEFFGVAALSTNNIWVVGGHSTSGNSSQTLPLVEHWNGTSWTVVPSPSVTPFSYFASVVALSANNIWAVGGYSTSSSFSQTLPLVEHWNGTSWIVVPNPNVNGSGRLSEVAAVSTSDIWAVGYDFKGALIEHWDGTSWTVVSSPSVGTPESSGSGASDLSGIVTVSKNDIWAVGRYNNGSINRVLIEHWDGTDWTVVPSPNANPTYGDWLSSVAALSANNIWAVGISGTPDGSQPLTEHWDGSNWTVVPSPNVSGYLSKIAAISTNNIWAIGSNTSGGTLIEHWDGSNWSIVASPGPGLISNSLSGIAVISASEVWAVGYCQSAKNGTHQPLIERYS